MFALALGGIVERLNNCAQELFELLDGAGVTSPFTRTVGEFLRHLSDFSWPMSGGGWLPPPPILMALLASLNSLIMQRAFALSSSSPLPADLFSTTASGANESMIIVSRDMEWSHSSGAVTMPMVITSSLAFSSATFDRSSAWLVVIASRWSSN